MSNLTAAGCQLAWQIADDKLYWFSQIVTFILSIVAMPGLCWVICIEIGRRTFNPNVKLLYKIYFIESLILVTNCVVAFGLHVAIPFTAVEDHCFLLVKKGVNRVIQYVGLFGVLSPMISMMGIVIERVFALALARVYEQSRFLLGPIIGLVVTLLGVVTVFLFFVDEKFDQPAISYFLMPATSGAKMNSLCFFLLALTTGALGLNLLLIYLNILVKNKNRYESLSTRFQLEENIITTKFSALISLGHVIAFSLYLGCTLLIRNVAPKVFRDEVTLVTLRGVYMTMPVYNLFIPYASHWYLNRLYRKKKEKLDREIALKYRGSEGQAIHEMVTKDIWRSHQSRVLPSVITVLRRA